MTPAPLPAVVRRGVRWALAAQLAAQFLGLLFLAALFRLVPREEFGLLGMALPVALLLRTCVSLGLSAAAVQREQLSLAQQSALFWYHLAAALLAAGATAAVGPLLAAWYGAPRLAVLCAVLSGTALAGALGSQQIALLERELKLGRLGGARLGAQAAAGVAGVLAAWAGQGVWALVLQQYVELLMLSALAWALTPWRPAWPWRCERVPGLVRFGGNFSLSNLLTVTSLTADKVLLSVMLGGSEAGRALLGMYSQAFNLMIKPVYVVTAPVNAVALPALSRVAQDRERFASQTTAFFRLLGIILFPCGIGLTLTAREAMLVLGGERWREAGVLLEALAPAILVHGLFGLCTFVLTSANRTGHLLAATCCKLLLLTQGYAAGYYLGAHYLPAPLGPVLGVAWGHSLAAAAILGVPYIVYSLRCVGASPGAVFWALSRALASAAAMGLVVFALRGLLPTLGDLPPAARLAALVAAGLAVYTLLAWKELRWLLVHFGPDLLTPADASKKSPNCS